MRPCLHSHIPLVAVNEMTRLAVLHSLRVLDSAPEAEFDEVVALAANASGCPMNFISLVADTRQWFKVRSMYHGLVLFMYRYSMCGKPKLTVAHAG